MKPKINFQIGAQYSALQMITTEMLAAGMQPWYYKILFYRAYEPGIDEYVFETPEGSYVFFTQDQVIKNQVMIERLNDYLTIKQKHSFTLQVNPLKSMLLIEWLADYKQETGNELTLNVDVIPGPVDKYFLIELSVTLDQLNQLKDYIRLNS